MAQSHEEVSITLPETPREKTNQLLADAGYETIENPAFYGQLKYSWTSPSSAVSSAVVPNFGQNGNENYIQAYVEYSDANPSQVAQTAFDVLVQTSLEQAAGRAGHSDIERLPSAAFVSVVHTAACEVVKRIWTTAVIEAKLAETLGKPAPPATFADAIRRERDSIDVMLEDGREFQVKSEAGSRDGEVPHIWVPNFEDYFDKSGITARVEE